MAFRNSKEVVEAYETLLEGMQIDTKTSIEEDFDADIDAWKAYIKVSHPEYESELEELEDLHEANVDGRNYWGEDEWDDGIAFILEDKLHRYVRDIAIEYTQNLPNYIEIDWEATVENYQQHLTQLDIGGETYFVEEP